MNCKDRRLTVVFITLFNKKEYKLYVEIYVHGQYLVMIKNLDKLLSSNQSGRTSRTVEIEASKEIK